MALLVVALTAPVALQAQVPGLPLRNAGITRGLTLAADVGFPNDISGLGTTYGASGALGFGLLGVSATAARIAPDGADVITALSGTANLRLIGGPLVPFSATIQGGAGRWSSESIGGDFVAEATVTSFTAGLGMAWTIASPVVSLKPWLAPRMQWNRTGPTGGAVTTTTSDPGLSGGIDLGFINGVSLRGMYDRVFSDGVDATVWSVGMGYSLRILR